MTIMCSGYCEHDKFMGECLECALEETDAIVEPVDR